MKNNLIMLNIAQRTLLSISEHIYNGIVCRFLEKERKIYRVY